MQDFDLLKQMVAEVEEDLHKAEGGNRAAGTRVRKKMQEIKAAAQVIRQRVLDTRDAGSEGDSAPQADNPAQADKPAQA